MKNNRKSVVTGYGEHYVLTCSQTWLSIFVFLNQPVDDIQFKNLNRGAYIGWQIDSLKHDV